MKQKTTEEYIETIYMLQNRNGYARTGMISIEMHVKPSSVTEVLQKLQSAGYVKYEPYKGAMLTNAGMRIARELMEKHKIIANFLEIIGIERELAELDACQIEHHVSPKTMNRLEKFVEFIQNSPQKPKWMEHFNYYTKTGKRKMCTFYKEEKV